MTLVFCLTFTVHWEKLTALASRGPGALQLDLTGVWQQTGHQWRQRDLNMMRPTHRSSSIVSSDPRQQPVSESPSDSAHLQLRRKSMMMSPGECKSVGAIFTLITSSKWNGRLHELKCSGGAEICNRFILFKRRCYFVIFFVSFLMYNHICIYLHFPETERMK